MNKFWPLIQQKILSFARLSKKQQYWSYGVVLLLTFSGLAIFYFQIDGEYGQQRRIQQQLLSQVRHQQKIIQSLQKKAQQQLLTPELAKQLLPVNQQIKQLLLPSINLKYSQWEMAQSPLLKLNLEGDFLSLRYFLFQILEKNRQLKLVECQFVKVPSQSSEEPWENQGNLEEGNHPQEPSQTSSNGKIEAQILLQLQLL